MYQMISTVPMVLHTTRSSTLTLSLTLTGFLLHSDERSGPALSAPPIARARWTAAAFWWRAVDGAGGGLMMRDNLPLLRRCTVKSIAVDRSFMGLINGCWTRWG
jgi:hypothetical protein